MTTEVRSAIGRPEVPVLPRWPAHPQLVALLLVAATVGWRRGEYFSGALDPVVLAKGAVSLMALAIAFWAAQGHPRRPVGTGSLWFLGVVLGSSVFGAVTADTFVASSLVAVRVAVLAATIFFLLRAVPGLDVLAALVRACGAVALVAVATRSVAGWVTGLPAAASDRLAGGVPPLSPNEVALLAGLVLLFLAWRTVLGAASWWMAIAAAVFLAVLWTTGSRTALLVVVLGVGVMGLHARRARVGLVVGGLVLGGLAAVAVMLTGAVGEFADRGGTGISTLESRFIAWGAARSWAGSGWQQIFGGGLSVKIIPVEGQWWNEQPLDSSWVSVLVQAGLLGLTAALLWVLWAVRGAVRAPRPHHILGLGLLVFLLGRSVLESGLFDATPAFLFFLTVSLLSEGGSRERVCREAEAPDQPA